MAPRRSSKPKDNGRWKQQNLDSFLSSYSHNHPTPSSSSTSKQSRLSFGEEEFLITGDNFASLGDGCTVVPLPHPIPPTVMPFSSSYASLKDSRHGTLGPSTPAESVTQQGLTSNEVSFPHDPPPIASLLNVKLDIANPYHPFLDPNVEAVHPALRPVNTTGRPAKRRPRVYYGPAPTTASVQEWSAFVKVFDITYASIIANAPLTRPLRSLLTASLYKNKNISTKQWLLSMMREHCNPAVIRMSVQESAPTAYDLWRIGVPHTHDEADPVLGVTPATMVPAIGCYFKTSFSLNPEQPDLVYGGKATRRTAHQSFTNYGFHPRFDEHLVEFEKIVLCTDE